MTDEQIFLVCNNGVLPFWLALVLFPRASWTRRLVHSPIPALLLVPAYALLLFGDHPGPQNANFVTLAGVRAIFTTPRTVIACWIHYLLFDLFVGAWEARDARRAGVPHAALVVCLFATLMFGPIGLLLYLTVRFALTRRATLDEGSPT